MTPGKRHGCVPTALQVLADRVPLHATLAQTIRRRTAMLGRVEVLIAGDAWLHAQSVPHDTGRE